jgi:hypothetical protein
VPFASAAVAASGTLAPRSKVAPLVGWVSETVGGVFRPPQVTPLIAKLVGRGLLPL